MSTGVCIVNRSGIALAADSAGTYNRDTGSQMFYNSMDKVFSLSNNNICGAIIYGSMSLYNVSVEQLLGEFKVYFDARNPIDSLFDVWECFQNFIREKYSYYKFDEAEREYCYTLIQILIKKWGDKIKNVVAEKDADVQIDGILDELKNYIDKCIKISGFDIKQYIHSEYYDIYQQQIDSVVPELKSYVERYERFWTLICEYFHLSLDTEKNKETGIFFAGYGSDDAFPKCLHIKIHKLFKEGIKYIEERRYIGNGKNAEIIPVAQREEILTFCRGISSNFISSIPKKSKEIIDAQIDALSSSDFTDEQKKKIKSELGKCEKQLSDAIYSEIDADNIQPIFESVRLITLPEIAFLAESLVNITTLKRTYSLDGKQQTVGGPTDVAVISKADGFRWVKQKNKI